MSVVLKGDEVQNTGALVETCSCNHLEQLTVSQGMNLMGLILVFDTMLIRTPL